jgi:hypothetical protein
MNKKDIIIEAVLHKMFEYAGQVVYYENLKESKNEWQPYFTIPKENKEKWLAWGTNYLAKELELPQSRAKFEMDALDKVFGLKTY